MKKIVIIAAAYRLALNSEKEVIRSFKQANMQEMVIQRILV
jgi:hypothetical protein